MRQGRLVLHSYLLDSISIPLVAERVGLDEEAILTAQGPLSHNDSLIAFALLSIWKNI